MKDSIAKALFVVSLALLAYGYGLASYHFQWFPFAIARNGFLAASALLEVRKEGLDGQIIDFWDESGIVGPTYRSEHARAGKEPVLIVGNFRTYADASSGSAYLAWIADREGTILHAWKDSGEIWSPLTGRDTVGNYWRSYPLGAHLYPNGDLLVSYHGTGMFPSAMGLAKFDKDSNLLWKNNDYFHHWFSVAPNGEIYIPNERIAESPLKFPDYDRTIVCDKNRFPIDSVAVLDANGKKLREIDMLDAVLQSGLMGLFSGGSGGIKRIETCDPTHLNDAVVLQEDKAAEFPDFAAGDLMVSLRSLNMVGVIDPVTERFKWHAVGSSHHQHSPRFHLDNTILAFDNWGGRLSRGKTRILAIDVGSGDTSSVFPRDEAVLPQTPFSSDTAGHFDLNPSSERMLVSFTHQGLVWEIDVASGEVLWEFVNTHPVDGKPARISVYTAKYVGATDFELNYGKIR